MSITVYKETPTHYDIEEYCPYCDSMVALSYDYGDIAEGVCLETVCPFCGHRLMLCTLCEHCNDEDYYLRDDCDWSEADGCHRDRAHMKEE